MKVIHQAAQLAPGDRGVCVALGMFDGVHLGHQEVLRCAVRKAQRHQAIPVAITFSQHPSAVVAPERTPPLIYSLEQRLGVMASLGIEATWLIDFNHPFSLQSGEGFIRAMAHDFGRMQSICVGTNFSFGYRRTGNVALLEALGQELSFAIEAIPSVQSDGEVVSSTRIREMIQTGDLTGASRMLGRPYSIAGKVAKGEQLGQKLGFPTANLSVRGLALPPNGVYAGHVPRPDRPYLAVMNIGFRPTLNQPLPERRVEVHLLDFTGNLYGEDLEFAFTKRLRAEEKFASLPALQEQIARDVDAARRSTTETE